MTDGPNIIGPIGGLLGLGVMAYAAKGVVDVLKEKSQTEKAHKRIAKYRARNGADRIQNGLDRMLR